MEILLTKHGGRRMQDANLTRDEVAGIIERPQRVVNGGTADEYDGIVRGVLYRAIVAKDSHPPRSSPRTRSMCKERGMLVEFDPEADVLFVRIRDCADSSGKRIDERRIVHVDDHGDPVAVEFLFVSMGIDLRGIPCADEIAVAIGAFPRVAA